LPNPESRDALARMFDFIRGKLRGLAQP
jgi:hypothetical protein